MTAMHLTTDQADALTELVNIGYGRAAATLSEMTGYRITLAPPTASMYEIDALEPMFRRQLIGDVACVTQVYSGPIAGNAMLLLDRTSGLRLCRLLNDEVGESFDARAEETLSEAGNILLSACLGVFGNLLQVQVTFSIPRLRVESLTSLIASIRTEGKDLRHALVLRAQFHLRASNVTGYMLLIFGVASVDRVLEELEAWRNGM
jgi:chemotaxis protein CheC